MDDQPAAGWNWARLIGLALIGFVVGAAVPVYRGTAFLIDWYATGQEQWDCHTDKLAAQSQIAVLGPICGIGGSLVALAVGAMFCRR